MQRLVCSKQRARACVNEAEIAWFSEFIDPREADAAVQHGFAYELFVATYRFLLSF
jgi:hypothetical protein